MANRSGPVAVIMTQLGQAICFWPLSSHSASCLTCSSAHAPIASMFCSSVWGPVSAE